MNRWSLILALVCLGGALSVVACKLDPAKTPPCDPRHPDPVAGCFGANGEAGAPAVAPDGGIPSPRDGG